MPVSAGGVPLRRVSAYETKPKILLEVRNMGNLSPNIGLFLRRAWLMALFAALTGLWTQAQELRPRRAAQPARAETPRNPHVRARLAAADTNTNETPEEADTIPDMCLMFQPQERERIIATASAPEEQPFSLFAAHGLRGVAKAAGTYSATAYDLRGTCASGLTVRRGIIAADPRLLPLGTRVYLNAGPYSGTYLVADTGGVIKGRRIDIWMGSRREALSFGRRTVSITVIGYERITRPRSSWRRAKGKRYKMKFRARARSRR